MKSNPMSLLLTAAAGLGALVAAVLALVHVWSSRETGMLNYQVNMVNRYRMLGQALLNDSVEYSKKNPAINEIIAAATGGAMPPAATPAPAANVAPSPQAKPAPKPLGK